MTKIKNTKKGMAKKTLSMSLVVAMLATSNVPVWAAEFSDGTDAAFTSESEAPVVEDNTTDATEAQATGDAWNVKLTTELPKEMEWGDDSKTVGVEVKDIDGKNVTKTSGLKYFWKNAEGLGVSTPATLDTETVKIPEAPGTDVGESYVLYIYDEKGDFTYTSAAVTITAKDVNNTNAGFSLNNTGSRDYTGKEISKNVTVTQPKGVNIDFSIDYTGDLVNVGTVKVTATPINTTLYTGVLTGTITIGKVALSNALVSAALKNTEFAYTGNAITLKKGDFTITDKNTGADLKNDVTVPDSVTTSATKVGEYTASVTVTPSANSTKFTSGSATLTTTNKFKVTARDLSTVKVTVDSNIVKPDGKAYTAKDFTTSNVHFKDADGNDLNLFSDVDVTVPDNVINYGTYTLTLTPKKGHKDVTGTATASFTIASKSLSSAAFVGKGQTYAKAAEEFTGSQVTKDITKLGDVYLGGEKLDPADYEIQFGDNVKAGTNAGEIYIVGKRTYEGSKATITFDINKATVTTKDLEASEYVTYNKDAKKASDYATDINLVVKAHNKSNQEFTLKEGTDYDVAYAWDKNAAYGVITATVTLKSNGNYTTTAATLTKKINISDTAIKDADIQLKKTSYDYTGKVITPDFDVVVNGKTLERGTDYKIASIEKSAEVGTATLIIQGIKNSGYDYRIQAKATFEVTPVSAEKVSVTFGKTYTYDGTEKKPKVDDIQVKLDGVDVKNQFEITSYGENINAGKEAGSLVLTPKKANKNFTAETSKSATFEIKQNTLKGTLKIYDERGILLNNNTLPAFDYDGQSKEFAKVVFVPTTTGKQKVTDNDYEIKYVNNVTGGGDNNIGASVVVIAKGNYTASKSINDNSTGTPVKVENVAVQANFKINSKLYFTKKEVTVTDAEYAGPNMIAEPTIVVRDGDKVLVKDKDYELTGVTSAKANTAPSDKEYTCVVKGKGIYKNSTDVTVTWKVVKKNVANLDVRVELNDKGEAVLTVMNGNLKVDNKDFTVTLSDDKKTATVAATTGNKYYVGSKEVAVGGEVVKVGTPIISSVKVAGNKATVILSDEADGASGYDYVISTSKDPSDKEARVDVVKNQVQTYADFKYVPQGMYYAYCHAWTRDENGKKVFGEWSNVKSFTVTATTPEKPEILSVKRSGSTITVTYKESAYSEGYDVVLGNGSKKEHGETRPYQYGKYKKLNVKPGVCKAVFKNIPAGTYYVGVHSWNRSAEENNNKVFSKWSDLEKVTVK